MLSILEQKEVTVIFANVEDILLTNTVRHLFTSSSKITVNVGMQTFLSSLEERQRNCRLYIDQIGDILDQNMSNMQVYGVSPFITRDILCSLLFARNTVAIILSRSKRSNLYERLIRLWGRIFRSAALVRFRCN